MQLERLCGLQRVLGFSLAATAKSAKPKAAATPVREPLRQEGHLHRKQFLLLDGLWCLPGVLPRQHTLWPQCLLVNLSDQAVACGAHQVALP